MLEQLVELGVIEFQPDPLDDGVERRLKAIWIARTCLNCDADVFHALDGSTRIWCGRCDWKTTYTRGTPFYDGKSKSRPWTVSRADLTNGAGPTGERRNAQPPDGDSRRCSIEVGYRRPHFLGGNWLTLASK